MERKIYFGGDRYGKKGGKAGIDGLQRCGRHTGRGLFASTCLQSRIHTVFSQSAIQKFFYLLSFMIKFSRYFRPLSSYLQNPMHALAISGVIRSFKSTLASTNISFALFKLQNSSSLFPKTDDSLAFTMVFIIVDATI